MSDAPESRSGRSDSLGSMLQQAREAKGLTIAEVAERTHVRATYLEGLETGAYERLPEEIYTRNFLRLYARTVGVDPDEALQRYGRERGSASPAPGATHPGTDGAAPEAAAAGGAATGRARGPSAPTGQRAGEADAARAPANPARPATSGRAGPPRRLPPSVGPLLATLVLAGALVGVAVWGFNRLLFRPEQNLAGDSPPPPAVEGAPAEPSGGAGDTTGLAGAALPEEVELTIRTEPAGAEVSIDAFPLPGTTPIEGVPVSARADRTVRITREGYQPFEESVDLSADRTLDVTLEPLPPAGEPVEAGATEAGDERLVIEVNEASWLEVYRGTARGEGERLVYTTAQAGERYAFEELPLYVHLGNASGVDISLDGEPQEDLAAAGSVTGRAFGTP